MKVKSYQSRSLHDLRSSNSVSAVFKDPVDTYSAIYSLLPFGRERFVAGGALHSLIKIFDLRMPGGKMYYAANLEASSEREEASHESRGWNVFMGRGGSATRAKSNSPVYSLSRPSPVSPSFFAGLENGVIQVDLVSIMDRYPDPIYRHYVPIKSDLKGAQQRQQKWDPWGTVLALSMYEQDTGPLQLREQLKVGLVESRGGQLKGWDERWR